MYMFMQYFDNSNKGKINGFQRTLIVQVGT